MDKIMDKNADEYNEQLENEIWYGGNAEKLNAFYSQFNNSTMVKFNYFWSKSFGYDYIRKIHSGLPAMIVDKLLQISIRDGYNISASIQGKEEKEDSKTNIRFEEILDDNGFEDILKDATALTLVNPKGAFKISSDPEITKYPIVEFVKSKNVEVIYKRNRLFEVVFKNYYEKIKKYCLKEAYGKGYIRYELFEVKNNELLPVALDSIDETLEYAKYKDGIFEFKNQNVIYAVPFSIYDESIYAKKKDIFDAIDETLSIMGDAVRDSRTERYIPEDKLPTDLRTGEKLLPDGFDSRYILTNPSGKDIDEKIQIVQPDIKFDGYEGTLKSYIYQALLGLLSPSTLGLDMAGKDNAEAQREREKTSIFTRTDILRSLENTIQELGEKLLQADDEINGRTIGMYDISIEFTEYASLSFEDKITTMATAKQAKILPDSLIIDELYGDSKTDEEKKVILSELAKADINIDFGDMLPKE